MIEIIISLAIFGILMVLFTTLMGVAIQMRKNVFEQNRNSMALMKDLALNEKLKSDSKEMEFKLQKEENGEEITFKIEGQLKSKEEKGLKYYLFVPIE